MKYDNIFLKDLMQEGKSIAKEQEILDIRKKALIQQKKDYIKNYFAQYSIEGIKELPISHNIFISHPDFFIRENEDGKISWIARGSRTTIKDGQATYGHAKDEFWQGQWEALPDGVKKLTIEQAKEKSKSVFAMSPSIFRGTDFSAQAYILYENEDGFQLVWRKAGTAYINRMSGSASANSGLQILFNQQHTDFRRDSEKERKAWEKISDAYHKATGKNCRFSTCYASLTEGGRLSVGLLEKEKHNIDLIFGNGVTQEVIGKLKLHQANKTKNKKVLKGEKDNIVLEDDPLKHPNVQPGKLKL